MAKALFFVCYKVSIPQAVSTVATSETLETRKLRRVSIPQAVSTVAT